MTTKDIDGNFSSYYRFKIVNSIENNLINYADNEQEEYCYKQNNLYCYLIIPIINNNINENYFLYASNINNYDSKISISTSVKLQSLFETINDYSSFKIIAISIINQILMELYLLIYQNQKKKIII